MPVVTLPVRSKIVRLNSRVCVIAPLVPLRVIVYVPGVALEDAAIVSVEVADPPEGGVTVVVVKVGVMPAIGGEISSVTAELNPSSESTETVDVPDFPTSTTNESGDADSAKSGNPVVKSLLQTPSVISTVHSSALTMLPRSLITSIL